MNLYDIRKNIINDILREKDRLREHARIGNRLYMNIIIDNIDYLEKQPEEVEEQIWKEQKREILEDLLF